MNEQAYDFIVVGAGSAGCVLANRLSADPANSVLLIEAGPPDRHPYIKIPAAFSKLFKSSRDWDYTTEPVSGFDGREVYVPRGKTFGGSSSINAMIYIRGNRLDFDGWAQAGCTGWSYEEVLPYFKRAEHNERIVDEYHGQGGPLTISDLPTPNHMTEIFLQACAGQGIDHIADFNGASQQGASLFQVNQKGGKRWSSADAYLRPARRRKNLTVVSGATVNRIALSQGRATNVDYRTSSGFRSATAAEEVLVCAGAIGSPQLLMLSGIGPEKHLQQLGINVVANLPVGYGLQDHPVVPVIYDCVQPVTLDDAEQPRHLLHYLVNRGGKLRSNLSEAGAFTKTTATKASPDLQLHFGPLYFNNHGFTRYDGNAFSIGPTLVDVASRGRVLLRSANPSDPARIDGNYLSEQSDIETLIAGVHLARKIAAAESFKPYRGAELKPGPDLSSDNEIERYIRRSAELIYHPVGTCQMGVGQSAVIDPELAVIGIEGLRVVDASIMPKIVSGNTNAATVMIAEKAADLILG